MASCDGGGGFSAMKTLRALPMAIVTTWWSRSAGGASVRPRCGFARRHGGGPARTGARLISHRSLRGHASHGSKRCGRCAKPSPPGPTPSTSMCCERGWAVPSVAGPSRGAPGDHTPTICATANAPWSRAAAPGAARCARSEPTGSMHGSGRISVRSSVRQPSSQKRSGGPVPERYGPPTRVRGSASSSTRGARPSARLSGW